MTGRVGGFDLGLLHIRTDQEEVSDAQPTNFSIVRLKRDLFRQSSVGLLVTGRSVGLAGTGGERRICVDSSFLFLDNTLSIDSYWAQTQTERLEGKTTSYRANLDFDGDRYGVPVERLVVGDAFNPEVGFVRRDNIRKSAERFRFSPRLLGVASFRKLSWTGSIDYIENVTGQLETRESDVEFGIEFENSDRFRIRYRQSQEFLPETFEISPDIVLPVRGYDFGAVRVRYRFGSKRRATADVRVEHGAFFSGRRTMFRVGRGRVKLTPQFAIEPVYSLNSVELAEGAFTAHLVSSRAIYTATPKMFMSALLQFNSDNRTVATNVRFRWEYQSGSELFVVYNGGAQYIDAEISRVRESSVHRQAYSPLPFLMLQFR